MDCCECSMKFILFVFNLACALIGLVILGISTVSFINGNSFSTLLSGEITVLSIALCVIGAVIFFIAFFGCCGAIREDTCMLTTYGVLLSSILLVQIAIGITAFVYRNQFESGFNKEIEKSFEDKSDPTNKMLVDDLQRSFKCCGLTGPNFYTTPDLPGSCCGLKSTDVCKRQNAYLEGCEPTIRNVINATFKTLGAVSLGLAFVELVCVIFAFCLSSSIKRGELRSYS